MKIRVTKTRKGGQSVSKHHAANATRAAAKRIRTKPDRARYASLTQIASAVTGTHWSGPRFFGLATSQRSTSGRKARDGS